MTSFPVQRAEDQQAVDQYVLASPRTKATTATGHIRNQGDDIRSSLSSGQHNTYSGAIQPSSEQNPELLHWRANRLLDEMMLGAIDIAANDSVPARALGKSYNSPVAQASSSSLNNHEHNIYEWQQAATQYKRSVEHSDRDTLSSEISIRQKRAIDAPPRAEPSVGSSATRSETPGSSADQANSQLRNGTEQWLFAAEQRYEQLAARQQSTRTNHHTTGYEEYDGWSLAEGDAGTASASDFVTSYNRENNYERLSSFEQPNSTPTATKKTEGVAAVGKAATSKTNRKNLRSNLLPRMSTLDNQAVQQEMALLQNSIQAVLSEGHESRIRAQHLLEKAAVILQNDPTHSAEVDYYLQQVRMIVRRVQETVQWSNLYKRRLQTYLISWLALSLIFIVGRYSYGAALAAFVGQLGGQSAGDMAVYNLLTIITAFFFGALGGGVGALYNLLRHMRQEHGFFDRKYGLRGLILPLIGALSGLTLCVFFGLFYALLSIDPTTSIWYGLVPALLAMLLGASQEHFYGTVAP